MTFPNQLTDQKRWCHDSWYEATCKNQETRVKTDIAGSWSFSSRQELFLQTFSSFLSSIKPSETVPATSYTNFMRQQTMEFSYFYIMCCDEFFTILIIIMKMNFDKNPASIASSCCCLGQSTSRNIPRSWSSHYLRGQFFVFGVDNVGNNGTQTLCFVQILFIKFVTVSQQPQTMDLKAEGPPATSGSGLVAFKSRSFLASSFCGCCCKNW